MKVLLRPKLIIVKTFGFAILTGNVLSFVIMSGSNAAPVDDSRMMQLEQEVRGLQRLVDQQARRLDALENAMRLPRGGRAPAPSPAASAVTTTDASSAWLKTANWDKLRPGMSDTDVITILGPPTTSRKSGQSEPETGAQTLFYAMELEAGGFLSGQVIVVDHRVIEIHKPELK
jgi:hypothetical protein